MMAQNEVKLTTQWKVYQWLETFQSVRTSVVNEDGLGRPTTSRTADNFERDNALVQEDRLITATDIAEKLDISCGYENSIILEGLPKQLTDEHQRERVEMCMQCL
jgi:hypothetical protein